MARSHTPGSGSDRDWDALLKFGWTNSGFKAVAREIQPTVAFIANAMCRCFSDDLEQEGMIAVWRAIRRRRVVLRPKKSARNLLINIAVKRMVVARNNLLRVATENGRNLDKLPCVRQPKRDELCEGLMRLYLDYVLLHGKFQGAHTFVADKLDLDVSTVSSAFHKLATQYTR